MDRYKQVSAMQLIFLLASAEVMKGEQFEKSLNFWVWWPDWTGCAAIHSLMKTQVVLE